MATTLDTRGPIFMEAEADDESGHRTYRITFLVHSDSKFDGPALVMQTPGLPVPGSIWAFGNDLDVYAWCRPGMRVRRAPTVRSTGPVPDWHVERTFSTRPAAPMGGTSSGRPGGSGPGKGGNRQGCHDGRVEDPLLEPQGVSGSFLRRPDEWGYDVNGDPILTSSYEEFPADKLGFEVVNPTVSVEQNVPALELALCTSMLNTLNNTSLWGLPARTWRLSEFDWERKYHGQCYPYYVRKFKFEANYHVIVNPFTGDPELLPSWDKTLPDQGNKVLRGKWDRTADRYVVDSDADPLAPKDFSRYQDKDGNVTTVILNGAGRPYDAADADRSFDWVYVFGDPPTVNSTSGTYAAARAQSLAGGGPPEGAAEVYGPFNTTAQANAAVTAFNNDNDLLYGSILYRGWSGADGFPRPGSIKVVRYSEGNFLLLGIPTVL